MATTLANKHYMDPTGNDVYIGRGSKWGNPFSHKDGTKATFKVSSREEAVAKYREWILRQPELLMSLHELKDKQLVCYCTPQACHGDVLIDLIENTFFLVIAGSREFKDYKLLKETADQKLSKVKRKIVIVSGKARGADTLGERYAKERGYDVAEFPADWKRDKNGKYDRSAGHKRNRDMAKMPKTLRGGLLAFWDGASPGTRGMIEHCEGIGVQTKVVYY